MSQDTDKYTSYESGDLKAVIEYSNHVADEHRLLTVLVNHDPYIRALSYVGIYERIKPSEKTSK